MTDENVAKIGDLSQKQQPSPDELQADLAGVLNSFLERDGDAGHAVVVLESLQAGVLVHFVSGQVGKMLGGGEQA